VGHRLTQRAAEAGEDAWQEAADALDCAGVQQATAAALGKKKTKTPKTLKPLKTTASAPTQGL
jgi:hypothetical protein